MRISLIAVFTLAVLTNISSVSAQTKIDIPGPATVQESFSRSVIIILADGRITNGVNMGQGEVVSTVYKGLTPGAHVVMNGKPGFVVRKGPPAPADPTAYLVLLKWDNPMKADANKPEPIMAEPTVGMKGMGIDFTIEPATVFMTTVAQIKKIGFASTALVPEAALYHGLGFYSHKTKAMLGIIVGAHAPENVTVPDPKGTYSLMLIPAKDIMAFLGREMSRSFT